MDKFFDHFHGRQLPTDIHRWDISDYKEERLREGMAPSSVNLELAIIRSFYNWLIERELAEINPASGVKRAKVPERKPKGLPRFQVEALLKQCHSVRDGSIWWKNWNRHFKPRPNPHRRGQRRLSRDRQWRGAERPERWSALIVSPSLPVADWPTQRVGRFYNGRQTIEAGIKESKQFFASRHLPTRHQPGIALYEALVLLAQNLLRWFRPAVLADTRLARVGTKALVRSAAHCRALVAAGGSSLHFAADSPWAGVTLWLQRPLVFQLWFAFLDDVPVASSGP
jgi:hypothetical protein